MLPLLRDQKRPVRRGVGALFAVLVLGFGAQVLQVITGVGGLAATHVMVAWVESAALVCAALIVLARALVERREHKAWLWLGVGVLSWVLGNMYYFVALHDVETAPYPSISDALWLGVYPGAYAALGLLLRTRIRDFHASLWLDGCIGALTVGAGAAALVLPPVLAAASGSTAAVITNIAYPVADTVLIALLLGAFALCGWRPGRALWSVAAGMLVLAVSDAVYFVLIARNGYHEGTLLDVGWLFAFLLLAFASWQPPGGPRVRLEGWAIAVAPTTFTVAAVALLVYDHFVRINLGAVGLATGALAVSLVRMGLSFRELRWLSDSRRMALTDDLTGLGNRRALLGEITAALQAGEGKEQRFAVLLLDLDRFKQLNDSLGHRAGDLLLIELATRLRAALPPGAVVTRMGGDEFAIVLRDWDDVTALMALARAARGVLTRPFELDTMTVPVEGSIGVARHPEDASAVDALLHAADVAMYLAKQRRSGVELYAAAGDTSRHGFALAADLRKAIAAGEIVLHYQPKADVPSGATGGAEALARWDHPERGLIAPCRFLPLAEQAALMPALTGAVLRMALAQAATWDAGGYPLTVAVNVSAVNLLDPGFPAEVEAALSDAGVPPARLVLEITEDALMTDPRLAADVVRRLRAIGLSIAIDDFGTGYSSLAYLKDLAADELKIDRAFVGTLTADPATALIVASTIGLAHGLGLRVVAEGVEDAETWERLVTMGCDQIQGYHLSRPLTAEGLTAWLEERRRAGPAAHADLVPSVRG